MSTQVSNTLRIDDGNLSINLAIEAFFANQENYNLIHQVLGLRNYVLLISAKDFIFEVFQEVVLNPAVQEEAEARRMSSTGGNNKLNADNSYIDLTSLQGVGVDFEPFKPTTVFEQIISEQEAAPRIHVSQVLSHLKQLQYDLLKEKLFSQKEEASKFVDLVLETLDHTKIGSPVLNRLESPQYYLDERSFNSRVETALLMFSSRFNIQLESNQLEKIRKVCSDFFKKIASQN